MSNDLLGKVQSKHLRIFLDDKYPNTKKLCFYTGHEVIDANYKMSSGIWFCVIIPKSKKYSPVGALHPLSYRSIINSFVIQF